jgi:hypothetical protein
MSQVLKQGPHEDSDFCESSAMQTKRSVFRKIPGVFCDVFTLLFSFRFSIAAMIVVTRG